MTGANDIRVKVLLFSHLKYALGSSELEVALPQGATAADLMAHIREMVEESVAGIPLRAAVNQVYVPDDTLLHDGDEVVFISPVQGGSSW